MKLREFAEVVGTPERVIRFLISEGILPRAKATGGAAENAGGTKGGNISGAFERGLNGSGSGCGTGANDVTGLFDLALDVGAEELRESSGCTAGNAARDTAPEAEGCAGSRAS